jgi:SAM-dependent methyltransferase
MASATEILSYYSRRAGEYESIYAKPERQADLAALEDQILDLVRGRNVLELACGTGYWTRRIVKSAQSVTATDRSLAVVAVARHSSSGNVRFLVSDALTPQPVSRQFTSLLAGFWWSHVPRQQLSSFVACFHANLSPGSIVIVFDNRFVPGASTPTSTPDANGNTFQRRQLADGSSYFVLKNYPDSREIESIVSLNGATSLRHIAFTHYWLTSYRT